MTEVPEYDSCDPCETLKRVNTTIGDGYGCEVCQMTYIQVDKGAYIPFDQALRLAQEKKRRSEERAKVQAKQRLQARPPKQKKKRKKVRR